MRRYEIIDVAPKPRDRSPVVPDNANVPPDGDPPANHMVRAQRTSVMLMAIVEQFGGKNASKHRVRDLSVGGIRIDNAAGLRAGATVVISVGALQAIGATVQWVREGFAGLAFAEQINPADAHKKAAITPAVPVQPVKVDAPRSAPPPTAGWIDDLRNPYRRV